ncbi:HNH endonuclease [Devosia honganensis]|uniref:HNH endonuclease n=1 Tax=Devosia honganensis TaxID=1610527 RepID=A0ABV7X6I5_9HYPH
MARSRPEWVGKTDDAMPGIHVLLRLYANQNGICACPDQCGLVMNLDRDEIDCDHKIPLRDGGENRESNLQLMFRAHHRTKTADENVARGKERQHKAKAFTAIRQRKAAIRSAGFPKSAPQRSATRKIEKWNLLS